MRGANSSTTLLACLYLATVLSCAVRTRAEETSLPFRIAGIEAYQTHDIVVWSEAGLLTVKSKEDKWPAPCKLPLQVVNQVLVAGADIYVVGAVNPSSRAALRINTACEVLEQWKLPAVWADVVIERRAPIIVTVEGIAPLLTGSKVGPVEPYMRTGPTSRAGVGTVHWLFADTGHILCRNRDQSLRGDSPGWCALQKPDGWVVSGNFTDAISCAGLVIVRESLDAKQVRWTSLSPTNGHRVADVALPRGVAKCVDNRYLLSADKSIRLLDAKTFRVLSTSAPNDSSIDALAVSAEDFVFTSEKNSIQTLSRREPAKR